MGVGARCNRDVIEVNKRSNSDPSSAVLCAGFPCQPFSQAGHKRGFKDNKDGNLFFSIKEILRIKKPKAFFLENVRHLKNHDEGRTFKIIYKTIFDIQFIDTKNTNNKY